ncbi:uroporphyrinogen-III synthase [Pigmentiphaga soli]|uniref:uroporphyrinogen-III synthase n=1 Tax=Pigmentiphaga soli TaxID=1007095 RepID=UPI003CD058B3
MAAQLRAAGYEVLELPALRLLPIDAPAPDPAAFDLVMFVSGNAVRAYLDARAARGAGAWPAGVPAAVVGPASAAALRAHPGFGAAPAVVQPPPAAGHFDSEALWRELQAMPRLPARVLIVRGGSGPQGSGRDWLAERLREGGSRVAVHQAYRREPAGWDAAQRATLLRLAQAGRPALWLVTSGEGADALRAGLAGLGLLPWWRRCRLLATHPRIAGHLIAIMDNEEAGTSAAPMLQTCSPSDDDILAAIKSSL